MYEQFPDPQTDNLIGEFKTWLDKYSGSMLSVTGNTDLVGSAEYFVQPAQTVTGAVITIVALLLVAVIIGYFTAWL